VAAAGGRRGEGRSECRAVEPVEAGACVRVTRSWPRGFPIDALRQPLTVNCPRPDRGTSDRTRTDGVAVLESVPPTRQASTSPLALLLLNGPSASDRPKLEPRCRARGGPAYQGHLVEFKLS